jgi:uncharacterized protein (DUF488 family)
MDIFTMGSSKKSAEEFFKIIKENDIEILIDVRLNNQSQLLGFTKGRDLKYFLKNIFDCEYSHEPNFAPTKEILDEYKKKEISWEEYENRYNKLLEKRKINPNFNDKYGERANVVLLCSEPTPENCHRRLLAEKLDENNEYNVVHL